MVDANQPGQDNQAMPGTNYSFTLWLWVPSIVKTVRRFTRDNLTGQSAG
jgi:hypothetical protein